MASDVNVRNTRNTDSLNVYIPMPNIECYQKSFKYAGGKIWNDLPNNIQNAPSVEAFNCAYNIISSFALENNAHCLKRLQLVSTDYLNS